MASHYCYRYKKITARGHPNHHQDQPNHQNHYGSIGKRRKTYENILKLRKKEFEGAESKRRERKESQKRSRELQEAPKETQSHDLLSLSAFPSLQKEDKSRNESVELGPAWSPDTLAHASLDIITLEKIIGIRRLALDALLPPHRRVGGLVF